VNSNASETNRRVSKKSEASAVARLAKHRAYLRIIKNIPTSAFDEFTPFTG